ELELAIPVLLYTTEAEQVSARWCEPATFATLASPAPDSPALEYFLRRMPCLCTLEKAFRHAKEAVLDPDSSSSELLRRLWQELEKMPIYSWRWVPETPVPNGSLLKVRLEVADPQFLEKLVNESSRTLPLQARHSVDFRSVYWFGKNFTFTAT